MDSIRNMRYGEDGYFMILNSQSTVLMHPAKAELNGKDVGDYEDPNGVYLFRDMVAVIKRNGKGFTAYSAAKLGATGFFPKIAYNVSYQPWDWILATGLYVDDLDAAFRSSLYQGLGILVVLAGVYRLSWYCSTVASSAHWAENRLMPPRLPTRLLTMI